MELTFGGGNVNSLVDARCPDCKRPAHGHTKLACLRAQMEAVELAEKERLERYETVMGYLYQRASILIEATNEHAVNVAMGKLKDAVANVDRYIRENR